MDSNVLSHLRSLLVRCVAPCVIVASGAFLFQGAGRYTVFDDEAFSSRRYVLPTDELIDALRHRVEPDPPLYYLAVHAWIRIWGIEPLAMRSLSILFFVAGLLALRSAAHAWFGPAAARWALLLCALHPLHLFFGFAARWYALMFLCSALLLAASGRIRRALITGTQPAASAYLAWVISAAMALYTNYFAPCIVGLTWLALWGRNGRDPKHRRSLIVAAALVVLLYAPWLPTFWHELAAFPRIERSIGAYVVCAARTATALATGNLADPGGLRLDDPGAWWVWLPAAGAAALLGLLVLQRRRELAGMLFIAGGSFLAGVVTLSMIDKYVMTFSAAAVLLVAGALAAKCPAGGAATHAGFGVNGPVIPAGAWRCRSAMLLLALTWIGCAANLVRERDWSSVRWLDPFESAVADVASQRGPNDVIVATHPSVRYYCGLLHARHIEGPVSERIAAWRAAYDSIDAPSAALAEQLAARQPPPRIWLIETAAIGSDAEALASFVSRLAPTYLRVQETRLAPDPAAARKDRLDPRFVHPTHRIVVKRLDAIDATDE